MALGSRTIDRPSLGARLGESDAFGVCDDRVYAGHDVTLFKHSEILATVGILFLGAWKIGIRNLVELEMVGVVGAAGQKRAYTPESSASLSTAGIQSNDV